MNEIVIVIFQVYCDGNSRENGEYVIRHMPAPSLSTLKNSVDSPGPNQYDILQVSQFMVYVFDIILN